MDSSVSTNVVFAVAERDGHDATELPPLAAAVDPDALDAMFRDGGGDGNVVVEFTYGNHAITVRGPDDITVSRR